jgi:hypothetical protein
MCQQPTVIIEHLALHPDFSRHQFTLQGPALQGYGLNLERLVNDVCPSRHVSVRGSERGPPIVQLFLCSVVAIAWLVITSSAREREHEDRGCQTGAVGQETKIGC